MKIYNKITKGYLLVLILWINYLNCSLLGAGVGAIADSGKPDNTMIFRIDANILIPGEYIHITMKNGSIVSGYFMKIGKIEPEILVDLYKDYAHNYSDLYYMPIIGDKITLEDNNGNKNVILFTGFDIYNDIFSGISLYLSEPVSGKKIYAKDLRYLSNTSGKSINARTLEKLLFNGELPLISSIKINTANGETDIPLHEVNVFVVPVKKSGAKKGFTIGALIDILFLFLGTK